jgi:glycosyltransferase involved in cell wall biosynthesis
MIIGNIQIQIKSTFRKVHFYLIRIISRGILIQIDFINGRHTADIFGTSKYIHEIFKRIPNIHLKPIEYPQITHSKNIDGLIKRTLYPLIVKKNAVGSTIKHITNQDLGFLLTIMDLRPSIVTCYDLIPVAYYHNNSLYWKLNLRGLQKADEIITISEFSKSEIIRYTRCNPEKISVISPGVDTTRYCPNPDRSILENFPISSDDQIILFVGSEEPRKNLTVLIKAFYQLKKTIPEIKLLKVGGSQMGGDRKSLQKLIKELNLSNDFIFTGHVTESALPLFYNAADLFVFPSRYEGFGMPPLEAMACGCPVICSNSTSLPEVVGDAGVLIDPSDEHDLALKMHDILVDPKIRKDMSRRGIHRARTFTWDDAAKKTMVIYENYQ